jgi:DNA-binding transcriptional regulator YiaG
VVLKPELLKLAWLRQALASGEARRIRQQSGTSLREAGRAIDTPHTAIYGWESGTRRPIGAAALRYADLLHDLDQLVAV